MVSSWPWPTNVRLGWKGFPGTNTLAYYKQFEPTNLVILVRAHYNSNNILTYPIDLATRIIARLLSCRVFTHLSILLYLAMLKWLKSTKSCSAHPFPTLTTWSWKVQITIWAATPFNILGSTDWIKQSTDVYIKELFGANLYFVCTADI